jgi:hypothetical protein
MGSCNTSLLRGKMLCAALLLGILPGCQLHKNSSCLPCPKQGEAPVSEEVSVAGLVEHPGMIELRPGISTLADAIAAAGGPIRRTDVPILAAPPVNPTLDQLLEKAEFDTGEIAKKASQPLDSAESTIAPDLDKLRRKMDLSIQDLMLYISKNSKGSDSFVNGLRQRRQVVVDKITEFNGTEVTSGGVPTANARDVKVAAEELQRFLAASRLQVFGSKYAPQMSVPESDPLSKGMLVELKRTEENRVSQYFFPLSFVESGEAGSIPLADGDVIFVKSQGQTALASSPATSGNSIALTGFVKQEAIYPLSGIPTLGEVQAVVHPKVNTSRVVVLLERKTSYGQSMFVFPYNVLGDDDSFGSAVTHPNDIIRVVPSFQTPLVSNLPSSRMSGQELAGQVDSIVANRPILNHEEKKHIRMQKAFRTASTKVGHLIRP